MVKGAILERFFDMSAVFRLTVEKCSCLGVVNESVDSAGPNRSKMADCWGNRVCSSWNSNAGEWWAICVSDLVVSRDGFAYEEIWLYGNCKSGSQVTRSKCPWIPVERSRIKVA